ncbi:hypothetical protein J6590_096701 [Homalodisca vitripennis]|nr:hypothetical protein J6590_096701 [Homalodisca vitripennis]
MVNGGAVTVKAEWRQPTPSGEVADYLAANELALALREPVINYLHDHYLLFITAVNMLMDNALSCHSKVVMY